MNRNLKTGTGSLAPRLPAWLAFCVQMPLAAAVAALPLMLSLSSTECVKGGPFFYPGLFGSLALAGAGSAWLLARRGFSFWECFTAGLVTVILGAVLMEVEIFIWASTAVLTSSAGAVGLT